MMRLTDCVHNIIKWARLAYVCVCVCVQTDTTVICTLTMTAVDVHRPLQHATSAHR